jgi:hypothetical protein
MLGSANRCGQRPVRTCPPAPSPGGLLGLAARLGELFFVTNQPERFVHSETVLRGQRRRQGVRALLGVRRILAWSSEQERSEADLHVARRHRLEDLVEPARADEAPGADDVRDDVDGERRGGHARGWVPAGAPGRAVYALLVHGMTAWPRAPE